MKTTNTLRRFLLLAGSSLLAISSSHAADVTWDTVGPANGTITGGAGTWDTTNGNWTTDTGLSNIAWVNANNDTAVFGGTAGTVTLGAPITVGGLKFDTAGYTFSATAGALTFGSSGDINTNTLANQNTTISSTLLSVAADKTVTKTGAGILTVSGGTSSNFLGTFAISEGTVRLEANTFTNLKYFGNIALNGGTLTGWRGSQVLQNTTNVTVGGTATINIGGSDDSASGQNRRLELGALSIGAHTLNISKTGGDGASDVSFTSATLTGNAIFNVQAQSMGSGAAILTLKGTLSDGGAGRTITKNGPGSMSWGAITLSGNHIWNVNAGTLTSGAVSGLGRSLTKNGVGIMNLTSANTYSGGTILNQGTIALGTSGTLGATTGSLQVNNSNSTAAGTNVILNLATGANTTVGSLSGTIAMPTSGTNTATINTQTGRTFTVNQTTNGTYAGVIAGNGNLTLGNLSNSKLTLTGTNTYSGATLVSAGTLFVSGSLTSNVTVSDGATLGGGGGTTGTISFGGASMFDILLAVGSADSLGASAISFASTGFGIDNLVANGSAVDWGTVADNTYTLITGSLTSTNLGNFGVGNAASIGVGRIAYFDSGSLVLVVATIPEPNAAALLGCLGSMLLLRRRRA